MASFVGPLSGLLGRPVIDLTSFTGTFDVHLKFARDGSLAIGGTSNELSALPSIFTAVHDLGLKIDAGKGPVDVFVVDAAHKPSEN